MVGNGRRTVPCRDYETLVMSALSATGNAAAGVPYSNPMNCFTVLVHQSPRMASQPHGQSKPAQTAAANSATETH